MKLDWRMFTVSIILIVISLLTLYEGSTDVGDYADASKYFAGEYPAAIRNSHSYLYGFVHAPLVALFESYLPLKVSGLVFLFLLMHSVYWMSGKDRRALWLLLLSPAVWYSGPWIGPLGIAGLSLLWGFWYLRRFQKRKNMRDVFYAGMILGLGIGFWHTLVFFTLILGFCYLIDTRILDGLVFTLGLVMGLVPLFALDWYLFGLPGYTLLKTMSGTLVIMFGGGVGALSNEETLSLLRRLLVLIIFPVSLWLLYRTRTFTKHWREGLFLGLSLLVILSNPQLRYTLVLAPVSVLITYALLPARYYRNALLLSGALALFVSIPYLFQIDTSLTADPAGVEITGVLEQREKLHLQRGWEGESLADSLAQIAQQYPGELFVVGPDADSYQTLAHGIWNAPLGALISMQDYKAYQENRTALYQKTLASHPSIAERRLVSITGKLEVNPAVLEHLNTVQYAIGIDAPVTDYGFRELQREGRLYLSRRG